MRDVQTIYGIDFSGAKDAGNKIWIAKSVPWDGGLLIKECFRARDLPNSGKQLESCLPSLVNLIKPNRNAAFGFDFPFGLPASLVEQNTWEGFVLKFPSLYGSREDFQEKCTSKAVQITGGCQKELKRKTDEAAKTPFSPYNLKIYKQTYYGIKKIIYPIVHNELACIQPMQESMDGKPLVLEICPASTLKRLHAYLPYKGRDETRRENRRKILNVIEGSCPAEIEQDEITHKIIEDNGGDALDSVIAAMATFNAIQNEDDLIPDDNGFWKIEGYVYV